MFGSAEGVGERGALRVEAAEELLEACEAQDEGLFVVLEPRLAPLDLVVEAVDRCTGVDCLAAADVSVYLPTGAS